MNSWTENIQNTHASVSISVQINIHDFLDLLVGRVELGQNHGVTSWAEAFEIEIYLHGVTRGRPLRKEKYLKN